jgi:4-hydroxy-tetrahydrodipicolinate synthase
MFRGIVCPMMSPVGDDGQVNVAATTALVRHLVAGPVDAILVAGTTGEFPCLSDLAWSALIEAALAEIKDAVPTIVNVSHCSVRMGNERARVAARNGASYVASTPPYYVPLGPDDLVSFYRRLAEASPVPLFLYNIPQFTQSDLLAVLPRIAEHPNVAGIKDSSGLFEGLAAIPRRVSRPFVRLAGTDVLLPAAAAQGLDGVVPGLANVVPGLFHKWWSALQTGDADRAAQFEEAIRQFTDLYALIPGSTPYMQVFRSGLRAIGIEPGSSNGIENTLADHVHRGLDEALAVAGRLA